LIEITPVNIRIRKMELDPKNRKVKTRENNWFLL
jgi:predicted membrane GTPase involved in stress response